MTRAELIQLKKGLAFTSPWILGFLIFGLIPACLSLYYSFCDYTLLQSPVWTGLENYNTLIHDDLIWLTLKNTALYAILSLPLFQIVSVAIAILLNQKVPGQSIYRTIIYLPSLVPAVASAMLWMWLYDTKLGLINTLLDRAPFSWLLMGLNHILTFLHVSPIQQPIGWLSDPAWALPALAFMSVWGVGQTVVIYLAGLQDVPKEYYESAELDGAKPFQRLIHITLPMISPVIFFNLIMGIIGTLQVFSQPYIMTGGGPARSTYLFTQYLYENAFQNLKMGYASAMAWVQLIITLILTAIAFASSKRWVHYSAK